MAIGTLILTPELLVGMMKAVKPGPPVTIEVVKNPLPDDAELKGIHQGIDGVLLLECDCSSLKERTQFAPPLLQATEHKGMIPSADLSGLQRYSADYDLREVPSDQGMFVLWQDVEDLINRFTRKEVE